MEGNGFVINDDKTSMYSITTSKPNEKEVEQVAEINTENITEVKEINDILEDKDENIKLVEVPDL